MAQFSAGIDTKATGALKLTFEMSEERAQDIFAMLLETSAPITRERTVPDPTEDNPNGTKVESYQDERKLGECLTDRVNAFIMGIEAEAIAHKKAVAAEKASDAVTDQPEAKIAA